MNNKFWIGGKHAVLAAIKNPNRSINKIVLDKSIDENDIKEIKFLSKNSIDLTEKEKIKKLFTDKEFVHQGYAAQISPLPSMPLNNFLKSISKENILLPILEDITDPGNLGSIIRSCVAYDIKHILIKENSFNEKSPYLYKAASGACEQIQFIKITNISTSIRVLQNSGFWIYGTDLSTDKYMNDLIIDRGKYAIIFGSEEKGIKKLTKENCDYLFKIKISKNIESLNVSNSCSIILNHFANKLK